MYECGSSARAVAKHRRLIHAKDRRKNWLHVDIRLHLRGDGFRSSPGVSKYPKPYQPDPVDTAQACQKSEINDPIFENWRESHFFFRSRTNICSVGLGRPWFPCERQMVGL